MSKEQNLPEEELVHDHHHEDECDCCGHDHDHEEHEHHHHHHEHGDECGCGCGHDHDHEEHEHHHHHEHGDECDCCGHDHDHEEHEHHHHHEHGDECGCGCGHDHDHEEHEHHHEHHPHSAKSQKRVYLLEELDCANCAAKIERKLNTLEGVDEAVITFATKQLALYAKDPEKVFPAVEATITQMEPDVKVVPVDTNKPKAHSHEEEAEENKIPELIIGAVALAAGLLLSHFATGGLAKWGSLAVCLVGYLLVGRNVLKTSVKNIARGKIFDENFLMTIATIGAFVVGEYPEALGVMLFYRVGEYFEDKAVARSRSNIMEALDLRPETVTLVNEQGETKVIPAEEARVGDLVQVRPGDRIPLDSVVVSGESQIDTSAVTGEPVPVAVHPGDNVISGCVNNTGLLTLRVQAVLAESMVSRILNSVENAAASKPQIDRFITRFARIYTPVVVGAAALVAVVPSLVTGEWLYWLKTACTFLVISCPCALVLSVPLSFFAGIGTASKKRILFKGGNSIEALTKVKAIVMDKTGTITLGNFVVQTLEPAAGVEEKSLLLTAAKCEKHSTHPIARSILTAAGENVESPTNVEEIAGKGVLADGILCGSRGLLEVYGVEIPSLTAAPGCTEVLLAEQTGKYLGRILISDTVKPGAQKAISRLHQMGMTTVMLTGDGENSANAVAQQVGIQQVKAKLLPQEKLSALQDIRQQSGGVMFVGDGINDAPVLAGADVGAAMGSGADAAIEAADVVFMTNELGAIPEAIRIAKKVNVISKENVVFALVVKAFVLILGVLGLANMWFAVFADTGVALICIANSIRMLYQKN